MTKENRLNTRTYPVQQTHWSAVASIVLLIAALSVIGLRASHANDFEANEVFKGCGTVVLDDLYYCYMLEIGKEGHRMAVPGLESNFYPGDEVYVEGTITWGIPSFCAFDGEIDADVVIACGDCFADLNGDGVIDVLDLLILIQAWGPCEYDCPPSDLNNDGVVDTFDLLLLIENWGECPDTGP